MKISPTSSNAMRKYLARSASFIFPSSRLRDGSAPLRFSVRKFRAAKQHTKDSSTGSPIDRCQAAPRRDHEDSNARHIMKRCPFDEILFCGAAEWFCRRKLGGNGFSVGQFVQAAGRPGEGH